MVPSLTAVNRHGVPAAARPALRRPRGAAAAAEDAILLPGTMPDAEGFLRWASASAPGARGYWPCQAVATYALSGMPAIDTGVTAALGRSTPRRALERRALGAMGVAAAQMPTVVPMGQAAGTLPGSDAVVTGGTIDALCDQIVAGATEPGDVLVIFGATLIVWAVCEEWLVAPGLISYPHTTPERFLIGGPSNAGALFVDWARRLLRGTPRPGPERERLEPRLGRPGSGARCGCPTCGASARPSRTTRCARTSTGSTSARVPRRSSAPPYEASGFVVRRMLDRSGVKATRIVASGGGSRVTAWMAAVADATNLPVDAVAVPEGAALGAAYFARMAAGWRRRSTTRRAGPASAAGSSPTRPGCAPPRRATRGSASWAPARRRSRRPVGRERHLERAAVVLARQRLECRPPLLEPEAVGQHGGDVEPALGDQLEVVRDGVLAPALEVLHAERVRTRRW